MKFGFGHLKKFNDIEIDMFDGTVCSNGLEEKYLKINTEKEIIERRKKNKLKKYT